MRSSKPAILDDDDDVGYLADGMTSDVTFEKPETTSN